MLDQSLIGDPEPIQPLKCELCGQYFGDSEEEFEDYQSVGETGRCVDCFEEYGNEWPDRL